MEKEVRRSLADMEWLPHPTAKGVTMKPLVTLKNNGTDVSCLLIKIPKGGAVPEHVHQEQDDILYPLEGCGVMSVDGRGSFSLEPGCVVQVPKGTKHKIEQVTEELLLYDVFWPALI
jgi:quercetin dioxygenase-like cupin family protein